MTRARLPANRRDVLRTIGASAIVTGTFTGVSVANQHCDATVSSGSIQSAVDSASSGDTVCVEAGTYDENVIIDTEDITLSGPNAGISGSDDGRGSEAIITDGVKIIADGVTLDGLQVESSATNGVKLEEAVDDITIQNNVITNVAGGTFGPRAGGNGVQIQFTGSTDETADNIAVLNNKISEITTPDNDDGRTLAIGVNVLPRGNDVDLVVDNNEITDLEPGDAGSGASRRARAVSVDTQLDGDTDTGRVDGIEITNNDISGLRADRLFAVGLFEDGSVDPRRGVQDFLIERNDFDDFTTETDIEAAIFIGGYEELGDDHEVTLNNIEDGLVERFAEDQDGFTPGDEDALSAECNWWGHATGPEAEDNPQGKGQGVLGPIDYRPWSVRKIGRGENPERSCVGGQDSDNNSQGN